MGMEKEGGTDTAEAELETGKEETEGQDTTGKKPETETATDQAGEKTEEELKAEKEAAEAEEREKNIRASKEGTPEFLQRRIDREVNKRRKIEGELSKEREARIRSEEREKIIREFAEKGLKGPPDGKDSAGVGDDPKPKMPRMKDFEEQDDYEKAAEQYYDDLVKWQLREGKREQKRETERRERESAEGPTKKQQEQFTTRRDEIFDEIEEEFGDEVKEAIGTADDFVFPPGSPMQVAVFESEHAGKILKYLFDHKDESAKIARMKSFKGQIMEIDRIEKLVTTPKKKTTNAPLPTKPSGGGGAPSVDESKLSDSDWWERRQKQKTSSA